MDLEIDGVISAAWRNTEDGALPSLGDFVGVQIRERRKRTGLTISDLSRVTGISTSNLSKIETGGVSPSLASLAAICSALSVSVQELFQGFDDERDFVYVPAGQGMTLQSAPGRSGMICQLLSASAGQFPGFQPYTVTLDRNLGNAGAISRRGTQVIYVIEGEIDYRYGRRILTLKSGDAAIFDAATPHGPISIRGEVARYFCILLDPALTQDAERRRRPRTVAG